MARKKRGAGDATQNADTSAASSSETQGATMRKTGRRRRGAIGTRKTSGLRRRGRKTAVRAASRRKSTTGRTRRYTPAERARILATARREGLTGASAARRFGISEVTYYLWRKNARPAIREAARGVRESGVVDLAEDIRRELEKRIRELVPDIIRNEVSGVLSDLSGARRGRRRRR